jgi:GSCFA family
MKFKLTLEATKSNVQISYQDKLMLIGSCFTENIGAKMQKHLFSVKENPHGILFNPVSVVNAISDYIQCKQYTETDLFEYNELFNSWHHHTRFSDISSDAALNKINQSIKEAHHFLKQANQFVITLGSAWLYCLTHNAPSHSGLVVANNHKAPSNWFEKRLMLPKELTDLLQSIVHELQSFNSALQIIFTVSPVRHLREGLVENNRSKAVLIHAVHETIANTYGTYYFPSYEYVIDDLRDYRFYAEDLVHPNYAATQYVWEKWVESFYSEETQQIMKQVAELQLAMQHKPFNKGSKAHQQFLQNCLQKSEALAKLYPFLQLQETIAFFNGELVNNA